MPLFFFSRFSTLKFCFVRTRQLTSSSTSSRETGSTCPVYTSTTRSIRFAFILLLLVSIFSEKLKTLFMLTRLCSLHEYLSLGSSKRELVHITKKRLYLKSVVIGQTSLSYLSVKLPQVNYFHRFRWKKWTVLRGNLTASLLAVR